MQIPIRNPDKLYTVFVRKIVSGLYSGTGKIIRDPDLTSQDIPETIWIRIHNTRE